MKNTHRSKFTFFVAGKILVFIFSVFLLSFQIFANPGRIDLKFQNVLEVGSTVRAIEVQTDGKIIIFGAFTTRGAIVRATLARLNADGSVDATFNASDFIASIYGLASIYVMKLQPDGKILFGGSDRLLKRLNADGSVDPTFNLTGINILQVEDIELQTDGKILVSASCGMNLPCSPFVTRLNTNGGVDLINGSPFRYASEVQGSFYRISYVPVENKILVSGNLSYTINGTQYRGLVRLNLDGSLDPTFTTIISLNMSSDVFTVESESLGNGKILVWGEFDNVNGATRRGIAVLNSNGSVDTSFIPATNRLISSFSRIIISSVAVQADGKIIIGVGINSTTLVNGKPIARLNADGSFDYTFNPGGKNSRNLVQATLKIHNGNRLLIGGSFFRFNGFPRPGLARLNLF